MIKNICFILVLLSLTFAQDTTYTRYYDQCKKIVQGMTLQQKIGQTVQLNFQSITNRQKQQTDPNEALKWNLGGLIIPRDSAPTTDGNMATLPNDIQVDKLRDAYLKQTSDNWKKLTDRFKDLGVQVTAKDKAQYKIKFFIGTDAVHGDQHVLGNVIFPHNIGLSCSHNEQHFQNVGFWTQQSMKKSGFNYAYAPSVAVSHNPQWGRFYQSMGQEDEWVYKYGQSFVKGLMDVNNGKINGVLGAAKNFFGDGATRFGANQGSASVMNYKTYLSHNSPGYKGAIASSLGSVAVSYSATNLVPSSYDSYLKLSYLRQDLGFTGFTTTNYDQLQRSDNEFLPRTFFNVTEQQGYAMIVNGGTDMLMLSGTKIAVERILKHARKAILTGSIVQKRIDQSVIRILCVKMAMGLVVKTSGQQANHIQQTVSQIPQTSSGDQYQDSLDAVHQSLVLLKNSNTVPVRGIKSTIQHIILVGQSIYNLNGLTKIQLYRNFDNIGLQCGGWTVRWQGYQGNEFWADANKISSNATSILDALKNLQKTSKFTLYYPNYTSFSNEVTIQAQRKKYIEDLRLKKKNFNSKNTLIIGAFGQFPYAESAGDVNIPYCRLIDANPACLYSSRKNPYAPMQQKKTLKIDFSTFEKDVVDQVRGADKNIPLISVLFSGRPLLIDTILAESSAFVASWLPGTSGGQGVVDSITGDYIFRVNGTSDKRNTLSMDWPANMDTLKDFPVYSKDDAVPRIDQTLFKVGYGLSNVQSIQIADE